MQIGTMSITNQMRMVKDGITSVSPFRIKNYSNRPLLGYALYLFAETIIKKYETFDDYDLERAVLVFLQTLSRDAEAHEELKSLVEQTLRFLILWNQGNEVKNDIVCHHNVYRSNLRNEIELKLLHIKQLSLSQYQQLQKIYSSEKTEQNLAICKTLLSELHSAASTAAGATPGIRDKEIIKPTDTITDKLAIKPQSLAKPFRAILERVVNISHTPGNRELFYSSVRNQLVQHLIMDKMGDIRELENVLPSVYQNLLAGEGSGGILQKRQQVLELSQSEAQGESFALSPQVIQLFNIGEYTSLQRLYAQFFSPEQSREISHLIMNRQRLSPEVFSFLRQSSFNKSELVHIIEQGTWEEKVLVFEALNYAAENITSNQLNQTFTKNISTLHSLLKNIEKNDFDFTRNYELEGANLTLKQYISGEEYLIWNEIEKQVNQYKTTVTRQLNNINMLDRLLSPITINQVISHLGDSQDKGIYHNIGTEISLISAGERMASRLQDLDQRRSLTQDIANRWFRGDAVLQHRSPQLSASTSDSKPPVEFTGGKRAGVRGLIAQLSNLISTSRYHTHTFDDEKYRPMHGEEKIWFSSPLTSSPVDRQLPGYAKTIKGFPQGLLKATTTITLPKPALIMREPHIIRSLVGQPEPSMENQVFNTRSLYTPDNSSNFMLKNIANIALTVKNQLIEKLPLRSGYTAYDQSGNLIMKTAASQAVPMPQPGKKAEHWQPKEGVAIPAQEKQVPLMRNVYIQDMSGDLTLKSAENMAVKVIKNQLIEKLPLASMYAAFDKTGNLIMKRAASQAVPMTQPAKNAQHWRPIDPTTAPAREEQIPPMINVYNQDMSANLILRGSEDMAVTEIRDQLMERHFLKNFYDADKINISILKKVTNMAVSKIKTQLNINTYRSLNKTEPQEFSRYQVNQYYNSAEMILASNKEPIPEPTTAPLRMPTQSELISRFGNLIADPNLQPADLIDRQAGSLFTESQLNASAKPLGVPELVKKITLDERIIREEQRKVIEIIQKVQEQEAIINRLNNAYNQLQEEMASRVNEKKIASLILKELRAKLTLDRMRYGLQ